MIARQHDALIAMICGLIALPLLVAAFVAAGREHRNTGGDQ